MRDLKISDKTVTIGDKNVITDWKSARVVLPENLQQIIRANEAAKKEIKKQAKIIPTSKNIT